MRRLHIKPPSRTSWPARSVCTGPSACSCSSSASLSSHCGARAGDPIPLLYALRTQVLPCTILPGLPGQVGSPRRASVGPPYARKTTTQHLFPCHWQGSLSLLPPHQQTPPSCRRSAQSHCVSSRHVVGNHAQRKPVPGSVKRGDPLRIARLRGISPWDHGSRVCETRTQDGWFLQHSTA